MALDSTYLTSLCRELKSELAGGKIEKVQQPGRSDIVLTVKTHEGRKDVFLGGASGSARVSITRMDFEKPQEPPMFCMLLRKHLVGARINDIVKPENERIVVFDLDAPGMFGEGEKRRLIAELFGRTVNVILTDGEGIITDCLYRIGSIEDIRAVQPGMKYRLPPAQEKHDILTLTEAQLRDIILAADKDALLDKWLIKTFFGFSPLTARELCFRISSAVSAPLYSVDSEKLIEKLGHFKSFAMSGEAAPYLLLDGTGAPFDFSYMPILQYGASYSVVKTESFSQCIESFWGQKNEEDRRRQRANTLMKTVKGLRDRTERRLSLQKNELLSSENREYLRECGDIITSNLHTMKKGMTVLRAYDYYSPDGGDREIKLDPLKTPQQNAAKYYKDYTKAKSAESHLTEQIVKGEEELNYLESVIEELARAESAKDISDIRAELISAGVIREGGAKRREKRTVSGPMCFKSSTGLTIRVGRNNTQNDALTLKNSAKTDVWLHAQEIHGSHVIISCAGTEPDETTLNEAACLAAYYSQARSSGKVPVCYTLVKHVKKPNGARPGMVIYTDYKTINAEPDESLVNKLKV